MTQERRNTDRRQGDRRQSDRRELDGLHEHTRLGDLLQRRQLVSADALSSALGQQRFTGLRLGEQLAASRHIERSVLDMVLHEQEVLRKLFHRAEDVVIDASTRLGHLLETLGHVERHHIDSALDEQRQTGRQLGDILIERQHLSLQTLHDTLEYQAKLRKILVATLTALILASSVAPSLAEASRVATGSVSITLQILPQAPTVTLVDMDSSNGAPPLDVIGATLSLDQNGDYFVQPLQVTPQGHPVQSMDFHIDENASVPGGIMRIFVTPQ